MVRSSVLLITALLMGSTALTSPVTAATLGSQTSTQSIYTGLSQPLEGLPTEEAVEAESNQLIARRRRCGRRCQRAIYSRCRYSPYPGRCSRRFRRRVDSFIFGRKRDDDGDFFERRRGGIFDNVDLDIDLDFEFDD